MASPGTGVVSKQDLTFQPVWAVFYLEFYSVSHGTQVHREVRGISYKTTVVL